MESSEASSPTQRVYRGHWQASIPVTKPPDAEKKLQGRKVQSDTNPTLSKLAPEAKDRLANPEALPFSKVQAADASSGHLPEGHFVDKLEEVEVSFDIPEAEALHKTQEEAPSINPPTHAVHQKHSHATQKHRSKHAAPKLIDTAGKVHAEDKKILKKAQKQTLAIEHVREEGREITAKETKKRDSDASQHEDKHLNNDQKEFTLQERRFYKGTSQSSHVHTARPDRSKDSLINQDAEHKPRS